MKVKGRKLKIEVKVELRSIFFFMLLILMGCEQENDMKTAAGEMNFIVVDALITDEFKQQEVILTYPKKDMNAVSLPVSGASVIISNEDSVFFLQEQVAGSGKYISNHAFSALPGKNYTLKIISGNKVYSAKASMVPGMEFLPLRYTRTGQAGLYKIIWVSNPYNPNRPAMYEILFDWSDVPGYLNQDPETCKARMMVYTLPTLDVSEVFAPSKETILFPLGTKITENRYSLTNDHAEFLRELLMETAWQGGFFNTSAANVTTNLSAGAVGYFGVCAVNRKNILVIK